MTTLVDSLRAAASAGGVVAVPLAFVGGVLAGLNPCCIPLYPAAAATCCAGRCDEPNGALKSSGAFVAGVAIATAILGILAALAGRALTGLGGWASYLIALVPLAMGLHLLGWMKIPLPAISGTARRKGVLGAFASGLLLSLVLAPCGTPVLASVLSFAAYKQSAAYGGTLLFAYGLGVGLPILLLGAAATHLARRLDGRGWRTWVDRVTGALLLASGFYLLWAA
ncbi:MAG TPA: cytochrome c biogenesis CcdA family protein [Anaeromyxobacteraceae bacterium]|nr:cytochrome c biogenesis CcdA family protein [Anaeromyxobacteraceae bacterium]